jgi:hypothetical protein
MESSGMMGSSGVAGGASPISDAAGLAVKAPAKQGNFGFRMSPQYQSAVRNYLATRGAPVLGSGGISPQYSLMGMNRPATVAPVNAWRPASMQTPAQQYSSALQAALDAQKIQAAAAEAKASMHYDYNPVIG